MVFNFLTYLTRPALVPLGRLLVGVADPEETALAEGASEKLESDGEIDTVAVGESAGEAQSADAGEVCCDREDVGQVHLEGVVGFLAEAEGRFGRGGGDDGVDLGEGLVKVTADEGPNLLGAQVVGVVVTAAQHVGAEDDAALYLTPKSLGASLLVEREQVLGLG